MSNKEPGYVYILTNPSFREDWVKIGKSSRHVDVRSKELDNTAVPILQTRLANSTVFTDGEFVQVLLPQVNYIIKESSLCYNKKLCGLRNSLFHVCLYNA